MSHPGNRHGFVRVATAAPKLQVANCTYNALEMNALMETAQKDQVDVLVFPELGLTGYTAADLFHQDVLLRAVPDALREVLQGSANFSGITFVGLPLAVDDQLFNCAAVLHDGRILGFVPKSYPPNYKEFYESRWFRPASAARSKEIGRDGAAVPFGTNILFKASNVRGLVIAAEICEDLWVPHKPSTDHALNGATVLVNLSASNELTGKADYRRSLVTSQSANCVAAYAYASCGVNESTTDVVFGGHCLIAENGALLAESKRFQRDSTLTIADIDVQRLVDERMRSNSFSDCKKSSSTGGEYRTVCFELKEHWRRKERKKLFRHVEAHPFVPRGQEKLKERCEDVFETQVAGLAGRLNHVGSKHVTIGVSGGLDSTLALLVAVKTVDALGWSRDRIHGFTMPGFGTTARTKSNAHALMRLLGITVKEVSISSLSFQQLRQLSHKPFGIDLDQLTTQVSKQYMYQLPFDQDVNLDKLQDRIVEEFVARLQELPEGSKDLTFENVQARMRTSFLMNAGLVIGTGDLSELALGWCTYNGDHMSGYNVNCSIPKTLVKFLVAWAAENQFDGEVRKTLLDIVGTEISPELLPVGKDGQIKQKTEASVGPYELVDFFLYHMIRFGSSPAKILYLARQAKFNQDYDEKTLRHWLSLFLKRFFNNQFKRSCVPDGPKVGSVSLSPRGDWRMPSDAKVDLWLKALDND